MGGGGPNGALDVALAREEALHRFRDINWATYTRIAHACCSAGGFSLEKIEISALKEIETIAKPGADDANDGILTGACANTDGLRLRKRVVYFADEGKAIDAAPFLRMIRNDTGYVQYAASHLLALFLTVRPRFEDVDALCQWAVSVLKLGPGNSLNDPSRVNITRAAVASMMVLLRHQKSRNVFVKQGGVAPVAELLKSSQNRAQLAYELTFILWTLSFSDEAIEKFATTGVLGLLIQQVSAAPREKVVRVALETLQNLLGKLSGYFNERMIDGGLLKILNNMRERKWTDDDITKSIQSIRDVLIREYKELNTMERYEKELRTGNLNWGLLHTDKFWKENFMAFENKEFELIRLLIDLLEADDPKTVAVALFDLGEFVRFYPNGKHIVKRLGAKKVAMKLMTHENPEVQKQALQCISKMMVNKWEFVK
ncbi:V-type proton atpase subunit h, partial [Globisporangium splendens]